MSRPAGFVASVVAQTRMEARLTTRRGETVLAMIGVPIAAFLVVVALARDADVATALPRTMALAIVASGLVNLGIATAFERGYGVLKRLGGSPLGRSGLVASKVSVVLAIALLQVVGLLLVATAVGWRPPPGTSPLGIVVATLVGATTSAGLGLAIAGVLRAEAALVVANVLFLLATLFGGPLGSVVPLPADIEQVSRILPPGAIADALSVALGSAPPGADLGVSLAILGAWAVAATVVAARTFRWE